jgi:hypothetical protein
MNLLLKFSSFIIRLAFTILSRLLSILFQLLLPYILLLLRLLRRLMGISLSAIVTGPQRYMDRLAAEWTQQLIVMGGLRDHLDQVYGLCRFLATSLVVLGWVVTTLLTVAILRVVFGILI